MNSYKITKNIRLSCLSHIILPLFIIVIASGLLWNIPFTQIFFPTQISLDANTSLATSMKGLGKGDEAHCTITFPKLEYTGYDLIRGGSTVGSYYYYIHDTSCIFIILDSGLIEDTEDILYNYTVTACREDYDEMFNNMISLYAHDISWTPDGILSSSVGFLLSEIEHHTASYVVLFICCVFLLIVATYIIAINVLYFMFPKQLHPCYTIFRKALGIPLKKQERALRKLDMELSSDKIQTFGSTYITTKYFVDTNRHTSVVLPLKNIVWIYSTQRLNKLLWFNIKLSSFMTIVTDTGHMTTIHWKPSDDARRVYSYVEEFRPEIICRYSKSNKAEAKNRIREAKKLRKQTKK